MYNSSAYTSTSANNISSVKFYCRDSSGQVVVTYTYDAWGKVLSMTGSLSDTVGFRNPFRYRGYYYDTETGFYYLQTRYYDPEVGRFLNADGIIGANGGVLGCNIFAYCNNNPVMGYDPSGQGWFDDVGEWIDENIFQPVKTFVENVIDDVQNFDFDNEDEQIVSESHYFSWYHGLVLRSPLDRSGTFGVICLSHRIDRTPEKDVRHERGHNLQLELLGPIRYFFFIAIPSMNSSGSDYYDKPWEITADYLGGVERNYPSDQLSKGLEYLNALIPGNRHVSSSGRIHSGGGFGY